MISPLILTILVGELTALEVIVTDLLIGPIRFVSYLTLISLLAPGAIGSVEHSGTVQPQEPLHLLITKSSLPVLVTVNTHVPLACC